MADETMLMSNNVRIPRVALGTYQISSEQMNEVIDKAIAVGYRHFDCAWIYRNEPSVGQAFCKLWNKGVIKRSDLFLTSKLWCSFHRVDRVREQCLRSIADLQCTYLDLFLIHWPFAFADQVRPSVTCFTLIFISLD